MNRKSILLFLLILIIGSNVCLAQDTESFQKFWSDFREAVINNDTSKLISFTKLPIRTRGPQDSDPIIKYGRKKFIAVFREFLERPTGINFDDLNERQIDLIRKTKKITCDDYRIGDMEFECINGDWKLVLIYYWVIK